MPSRESSPAVGREQRRIVVDRTLLRQRLGLPEDASAAQINAALHSGAAPVRQPARAARPAPASPRRALKRDPERDRVVAAAASAGKIHDTPENRELWRRSWDRDPGRARHLLTASSADGGLVTPDDPVAAIGRGRLPASVSLLSASERAGGVSAERERVTPPLADGVSLLSACERRDGGRS